MANKSRNFVDSQDESMVASVYHFLHQEYEFTKLFTEPNCDLSHLRNITKRTAEATGVPLKTVQQILKDNKEMLSSTSLGFVNAATKRRVIRSEGRSIIASVFHFLKEEYEFTKMFMEPNSKFSHLGNITQRTAEATGVSTKTVNRVLKEEKELPSSSSNFASPMDKRKKRENKVDIDNSKADTVRNTIQNYYEVHREIPTLAKLKIELKDKIGFNGCLATLQKLLLKLGYEWRKINNKGKVKLTGPGLPNYFGENTSGSVDLSD